MRVLNMTPLRQGEERVQGKSKQLLATDVSKEAQHRRSDSRGLASILGIHICRTVRPCGVQRGRYADGSSIISLGVSAEAEWNPFSCSGSDGRGSLRCLTHPHHLANASWKAMTSQMGVPRRALSSL
ncbi:hypothetical protein SKAU_G00314020 [Synaphobranchus kaupii]|uniref:Uncharacterized protein n=1 Tax=Synaphobranchus kaupii TaxID=118154 RepID=A0A9Q1ESE9_SYNKA|nr:hypothetical protein SKAU_G00314020 [Synaphobranchus kaupii]